jgi:hypothetical protein
MRFLPIVDRELREGSRRGGTYWLRVRVAFQALVIGSAGFVVNFFQPQLKLGAVLFWGLSGVCLLFCLLAGRRSTADCLSQEKREGTLGLLFLTDLKGYDVVLGKLAATSIAGFYALVAVFPVLAIPLLTGGVTNGEFGRMALVLANTFFLSLAVGVLASAVSREHRTAMAVNFLLALLLLGAPAACGLGLLAAPAHRFVPWLFYSCPVFSFVSGGDDLHAGLTRDFWWSLAVSHGLAWLLTLLACWIVPHTWGDKPPPAPSRRWRWRELGRMIHFGSRAKCAAFRQQALNVNACYWLAARARLKPAQVWMLVGSAVIWWIYEWLNFRAYVMTEETCIFAGLIINSALKFWIITEAGQQWGEDRRSGAFELLLPTPLTVGDYLRGQMLALRRQFFKPLLLVTALELVLVLTLNQGPALGSQDILVLLAGVCMLWADSAALTWVAMAAALMCKSQTRAACFTVVRILILPWVAFAFIMACIGLLDFLDLAHWHPTDRFALGLWFGLGMGADLFFGLRARHVLRKNFRQLAAQSLLPEPARFPWWNSWRTAAQWVGRWAFRRVPERARRPVAAGLAVGVALAAVFFARLRQPHFPPPALISITHSNAPFRVFPGGASGVFFVMPDGTLWQWGRPGAPQAPRALAPEQVGVAHDWVKVVGAGTHCLGLRADGTIWGWGFSNGRICPEPQRAVDGHDWIDLGTGQHHAAALKRDGTLWLWGEPLVANNGRASQRGPFSTPSATRSGAPAPYDNWVSVYCGNNSTFALQKDGTLWAEGDISGFRGGTWVNTKFPFPTVVCADTNWTSLDATGMARNQAGELWDVAQALPNPQAGASAVCSLVSSNWALDRVCSAPSWTQAQVRANGTLWMAHLLPSSPPVPLAQDWGQLGARPDWVAVWGLEETGFGMTADGTVWTWGLELGTEPVKSYESRLELLRGRLTGRAIQTASKTSSSYSAQPRPLLKLVGGNKNEPRK